MANTGNDCPRFAGLLAYLGVGAPPPVDSPLIVGVVLPVESLFVGARGLSVALPPKLEPRRGGGDPPSPWLKRRPTVSKGLLALRLVLLRVNSLGFIGVSRLIGDNPSLELDKLVELLLFSDLFGLRGIKGLLLLLLSLPFTVFSSSSFSCSSDTVSIFSSCWTLRN